MTPLNLYEKFVYVHMCIFLGINKVSVTYKKGQEHKFYAKFYTES